MPQQNAFFTKLMESGQLRIDDNGHIILFGEYMFLLPAGPAVKLMDLLKKEVGGKKAGKIIMKLGEYQVEMAAQRYLKRFGLKEVDRKKIFDFTSNIIKNILGWGDIVFDYVSFEEKKARIFVKSGAFPLKYKLLYKKSSRSPVCYWLAGILRKHFSVIFGKEMKIKETKCLACGNNFCEFQVY